MNGFELRGYANYPTDTYSSQVRVLDNQDGTQSLYKANRFMWREETSAVVDFLTHLSDHPHPNLLSPEAFNGEPGQRIIEVYPLISDPILGRETFKIRDGIKAGQLNEADFVNMMLQLTSAVAYIHKLGYVHRDVRDQNIFVSQNQDQLHFTLFDYGTICRPYFQAEGVDGWNMERAPELRRGDVVVDARFDVYALGYTLFKLTHDDKHEPIQPLDPEHPLFEIMRKAKAPLDDCYADAVAMHDDLLRIAA